MAYIAFDLDSTLGFFELTNPFAYFWGPDRSTGKVSPKLDGLLKRARRRFADSLFQRKPLLWMILRPSLREWFSPILHARKYRKLNSIVIYSNTTSLYSLELAEYLLEQEFQVPDLLSLTADAYHPLRGADQLQRKPVYKYVEPLKQYSTLERLFQASVEWKVPMTPSEILFLDDRVPKHVLEETEKDGLTYLVVDKYYPKVTKSLKKELVTLAMEAIESVGLLSNQEYLASGFCVRKIVLETGAKRTLRGFPDLFSFVAEIMEEVPLRKAATIHDGPTIRGITEFLQKF